MPRNCLKCQTPNPDTAAFCSRCGATLGATMVQGRTVIQNAPVPVGPGYAAAPASPAPAGPVMTAPIPTGVPVQPQQSLGPQREHVILCNDRSGSMAEAYQGGLSKLDAAKRASISLILEKAQLDPEDEIGLVSFTGKATVDMALQPIRTHKPQLIQAVQALFARGNTNLDAGLRAAQDSFDWSRDTMVRRIVMLTDGCGGYPLRTAKHLKERGVIIDVIGIGANPSGVNENLLRNVASTVEGELHYWFIRDQQSLVMTYTQLAGKTVTRA
jgi:Mg-chelatase subunit ChlD